MFDFYRGLEKFPFIIAEIGINHNGDVGLAKQLIDMAKNAGCNAVKFPKENDRYRLYEEFLADPDRALGEQPSGRRRKVWSSARRSMTKSTVTAGRWISPGLPRHGMWRASSFFVNITWPS
jgi:hypothetical protein